MSVALLLALACKTPASCVVFSAIDRTPVNKLSSEDRFVPDSSPSSAFLRLWWSWTTWRRAFPYRRWPRSRMKVALGLASSMVSARTRPGKAHTGRPLSQVQSSCFYQHAACSASLDQREHQHCWKWSILWWSQHHYLPSSFFLLHTPHRASRRSIPAPSRAPIPMPTTANQKAGATCTYSDSKHSLIFTTSNWT